METLTFRVEWEPGPGVSHPALARTWSRLEVAIGDHRVTTVMDRRAGGSRTGVYGSAFVLAEWIVRNFWFGLWECQPSGRADRAWLARHSLATAREGMSLPNLRWFRDEDALVAEWGRDDLDLVERPVRFVESGRAGLEPADVSGPTRTSPRRAPT